MRNLELQLKIIRRTEAGRIPQLYILHLFKGKYQSGQMGLTVTQLAFAFGGSNPSLPTRMRQRRESVGSFGLAEVAQLIEH